MNSRLHVILRELLAASSALTSSYLASVLQVSSRTVRGDMKRLDQWLRERGASIQGEAGKGYRLIVNDDKTFRASLEELSRGNSDRDSVPVLPEERTAYLLKRLLLSGDYIKIEQLADELYVSKSTVQNDLKAVKNVLETYDIVLKARPNYGLKAEGREVDIRFCISEYVFNRPKGVSKVNGRTPHLLSPEEMDQLWSILLDEIYKSPLKIADIAMNNLYIHIAIAIQRIRNGYEISLVPKEIQDVEQQQEFQIAKRLVTNIERQFGVAFPKMEVAYITLHLLGAKMAAENVADDETVKHLLDDDIYRLVNAALDTVEEHLNVGLKRDRELMMGLGLHLKPAINRHKYRMNVRNPLLEDTKRNYPLAFEAALFFAKGVEEQIGIRFQEDECGYFALHIGAAIERQKAEQDAKTCLIVCASGFGSSQLIYYRLKAYFGDQLRILGTIDYYKLPKTNLDGVHFIVSTVPIEERLSVPVIHVNAILTDEDLAKVERYASDEESILRFFKRDLLFLQRDLATREDVFKFFQETLQEKGLVGDSFLQALFDREEVAPTAYGNLVAVPHPITPQSDETFVAVCTLKKPIQWAEQSVQFVCLLSVKRDSQEDLQSLYELLVKVTNNPTTVQALIKCENYDEFVKIVLDERHA